MCPPCCDACRMPNLLAKPVLQNCSRLPQKCALAFLLLYWVPNSQNFYITQKKRREGYRSIIANYSNLASGGIEPLISRIPPLFQASKRFESLNGPSIFRQGAVQRQMPPAGRSFACCPWEMRVSDQGRQEWPLKREIGREDGLCQVGFHCVKILSYKLTTVYIGFGDIQDSVHSSIISEQVTCNSVGRLEACGKKDLGN